MHNILEIFQGCKGNKILKLKSCEENEKEITDFIFRYLLDIKSVGQLRRVKLIIQYLKILTKFSIFVY